MSTLNGKSHTWFNRMELTGQCIGWDKWCPNEMKFGQMSPNILRVIQKNRHRLAMGQHHDEGPVRKG